MIIAQAVSAVASAASAAVAPVAAAVAASVPSTTDWADALKPFTPDAFANGFATLVGALSGAMLAYLFQRLFQRSQDHKAALMSAHRLMFALLQQINTIVLIQRDYVQTHLGNPGRFISIPPTPPFDTNKNVLQMESLAFLIDNAKGRAVLYNFYIAQENYIEALNQWNMRSTLHHQQLQPALAASPIANGATVTIEEVERALGSLLFGSMVNATNNVLETLQRAFEKLSDSKRQARAYVVERFKTTDFTDFDFPDTYGLTPPKPPAEGKR